MGRSTTELPTPFPRFITETSSRATGSMMTATCHSYGIATRIGVYQSDALTGHAGKGKGAKKTTSCCKRADAVPRYRLPGTRPGHQPEIPYECRFLPTRATHDSIHSRRRCRACRTYPRTGNAGLGKRSCHSIAAIPLE
uniref:Proline dipeptidase-like protein n=1 Tax=Theonella swinhoei bacterial symbiont clone pSW1H8 TaxID=377638 RepID=A4U8U3_9BACT|nr:proline dipeptidase-like protein [Theonella swinhoei bacterial symbiont clone pSW1H8]